MKNVHVWCKNSWKKYTWRFPATPVYVLLGTSPKRWRNEVNHYFIRDFHFVESHCISISNFIQGSPSLSRYDRYIYILYYMNYISKVLWWYHLEFPIWCFRMFWSSFWGWPCQALIREGRARLRGHVLRIERRCALGAPGRGWRLRLRNCGKQWKNAILL